MERWRQRQLGSKEDHSTSKGNYKTELTLAGLLMEGLGKRCLVGQPKLCIVNSLVESRGRVLSARDALFGLLGNLDFLGDTVEVVAVFFQVRIVERGIMNFQFRHCIRASCFVHGPERIF